MEGIDALWASIKQDAKQAISFLAAGIAFTIVSAEQRTAARLAQACIIALFVGYTSMPMIIEALRYAAFVDTQARTEVAGSIASLLAFAAHYVLTGMISLGKMFAADPLCVLRFLKRGK